MELDLTGLSDEELISLAANLRTEMRRRADDEFQAQREPRIAFRLAMESGGIVRGWSGYAAVTQDSEGVIHVMQPDRDNRVVDVWLRSPDSYTADMVSQLKLAVIAAVAGLVRP